MSRDYELGFILNPEVNEEQTRTILERIEQIVSNYGGQIMRVNQWGRRRLAYPIERNRDGFYVFIDMILTPETVSELDRTLKVSEEVIRHLIKKRDPKAVQKEREARATAAAAAAAQAEAAAETGSVPAPEVDVEAAPEPEAVPEVDVEAAPEPEAVAEGEGEAEAALPTDAEDETPVVLSAEENESVPPALEDETVEA